MAKKIITKIGTTAAFAVAMTAALSIQASADEIAENPAETPVVAPVVESPAPVETSTNVQEVTEHNAAVESSNDQVVQDNNNTVGENENTDSGNEFAAGENESTVSGNEGAAAGNDSTDSGNDSTASDNDSAVSGNEGTAAGNDSTASGNGSVDSGNDSAVSDNDSTDSTNQETVKDNAGKIEGNEDLTTELPNAPEKPNAPEAPETPDLSEAPEAPETPDLPDVPNAPEVPETPDLPEVPDAPDAIETPDLDTENTDDYNDAVGDYNDKVDDYNGAVEDYNNGVGDYNDAADDYNEAVGDYNDAADDYNEAVGNYNGAADEYNNAVDNYNGAVDSYNGAVGDANGKIDEYNQKVEDYNEKVDEYNGKVDEYNDAVDEINEELKAQFDKEHAEWKTDKETYDAALAAYKDYLIAEENFNKEYAQWEIDHKIWQDKLDAHKETYGYENEEEYKALVAAYEKAYGDWEAECTRLTNEYNAKKAVYDQLVAENQIYDDVLEYNEEVKTNNGTIEDLNDKLTSDLDTGAAENLEEAELNANVNAELNKTEAGKALLETLSAENRKKLADAEAALATEAAALDEEAKKNYTLGSEEYETYLTRVKEFNDAVKTHNDNLAAYNKAVADYNEYVDDFNADNKPVAGDSTTGNGYTEGEADWGNISTTNKKLDHIDVKYQAATSQTVTTDENGENPVYTENYTGYTVTGVYADQATAEAQQEKSERNRRYSVSYDRNGSANGGTGTQSLSKDSGNAEFGGPHGGNIGFDPINGTVSFYVTLKDEDGKEYGINVNLNDGTTFAEGSYYKAESKDLLKYYRYGENNSQSLKTVMIDGEEYFDVSGQSVFVISALTCEGTTGNAKSIKFSQISGLDLVLNLQTMIKTHQADNAQRLTYQSGYLMGKTAYAQKPAEPGTEPELKLPEFDGKLPGDFVPFTDPEPQEPKLDRVDPPKEFTDPEPQLVQLEKLTHIEKLNPIENKLNPIENKLNPVEKLNPIENKLNPIEKLDTIDTLDKLDYKMILVIPQEIPEEEPVWFNDDVVMEEEEPEINLLADDGAFVDILDEEVPLADAPLTGDASLLFGMASLFSLSGLYLTGKKRNRRA